MKKISMGTFRYKKKYADLILKSLKEGYLTAGPYIQEFQSKMSNIHGKRYGIFVNSGQSALQVAIGAIKEKTKSKELAVLCPSTTYLATLWAILLSGCRPILVDVNENYVIDPNAVDPDLKFDVLLSVDLCGYSAHKEVELIKKKVNHPFYVINDACEAVGNPAVKYGDVTCLSFYTSHIITTGAGGMICYDDEWYTDYINSYIAHGRALGGDFTKFTDKWEDRFKFDKIGVSYRESSLSAALGLAQVDELDFIINSRKALAKYLCDNLRRLGHFVVPSDEYIENCVFQFLPIKSDGSINREHFLNYLFENGIDSRVLLNLTDQPIIEKLFGENFKDHFPNSADANKNGFLLPCHQDISKEEARHIVRTIEEYVGEA